MNVITEEKYSTRKEKMGKIQKIKSSYSEVYIFLSRSYLFMI